VVDGDEIVISGQKVWTSGASRANRMFLLCRTDPDVDKHAGLSYVLIDFTDPGVQYRPIKQMSGAAEFFEDFLDQVRAPLFNVIGGLNNGWKVAMTTLGHERGGRATSGSSGTWPRPPASAARPPTRWSASSWPGPTRRSS
jgi:alkylation response protein AidB-like acyl-CoA dehydrogenase